MNCLIVIYILYKSIKIRIQRNSIFKFYLEMQLLGMDCDMMFVLHHHSIVYMLDLMVNGMDSFLGYIGNLQLPAKLIKALKY